MPFKSGLDLVRVSLMLPREDVDWIDAEVSAGRASSRAALVRKAVSQMQLRVMQKKPNGVDMIGGIPLDDIRRDWDTGDVDDVWMDSLSDRDRMRLINLFKEWSGEEEALRQRGIFTDTRGADEALEYLGIEE